MAETETPTDNQLPAPAETPAVSPPTDSPAAAPQTPPASPPDQPAAEVPPPSPPIEPASQSPAEAAGPEPAAAPPEQPAPAAPPAPPPEPVSAPDPEPAVPSPAQPSEQSVSAGAPDPVQALNDEQLRLAAALYLKKNQREISAKGVAARQAVMRKNMDRIEQFIRSHGACTLPQIARHCNITPRTTSSYLQKLVKANRVKAAGHAASRRYHM